MSDSELQAIVDAAPEEQEFYVEPAALARRDVLGIVLALVALTVIGVSGYIWINPDLSLAGILGKRDVQPPVQSPGAPGNPDPTPHQYPANAGLSDQWTEALMAAGDHSCPQCGMYADRSESQVAIIWQETGNLSYYDCWDCAFKWGQEQHLTMALTAVMEHGSSLAKPVGLNAKESHYLYGTKHIKGSMPPFIAAFGSREDAAAAQPELGGEIMDWEGLRAKFSP